MQRDEVIARLREIAQSGDDWFSVWETDEGGWQVADPTGNVAAVVVEDHWVEVRAGRPLGSGGWRQPVAGGTASLTYITLSGDDPPVVSYRARVYLDGFSLQALFMAARDVLSLAGPLLLASVLQPDPEPAVEVPAPERAEAPVAEMPVAEMLEEPSTEAEPEAAPEEPVEPTGELAAAAAEGVAASVEAPEVVEEALPPAPMSVEEATATPEPATPEAAAAAAIPPATEPPPTAAGTAEEPRVSSVGATVAIRRPSSGEPATPPTVETPIQPKPARQTCRRCGAEVEPGERFCINCGAPQPVGETTQATEPPPPPTATTARRSEPNTVAWRRPSPGAVLCPRCGESNPEEARECRSCGLSLAGAAAQAGDSPATGTKTCSQCAYVNPAGNRFCQGCGTALAE